MLALILLAVLQAGDLGSTVFSISADKDVAKCLPAMRDAIVATRAAWAPRSTIYLDGHTVAWGVQYENSWSFSCACGGCVVPTNLPESGRLRCEADRADEKEKAIVERVRLESKAAAALDAVGKACGEMK